jgi:EAL domain-containing protein (putative c-di-GMP-specific phosphodiesterase class I)/DICT domain-containing protein
MSRLSHVTSTLIPGRTSQPVHPPLMADIDDLVSRRFLKPQYQPIFDLATGEQVGSEALARWPELGVTPDAAFYTAALTGRLGELDEACRNAAIDDAITQTLPPRFELFVNLEPSVLGPDSALRLLEQSGGHLGLVVEITERALTDRPAQLLRAVDQLREAGFGIALDGVGAAPGSLALLPFIAPDVVKLDVSLLHRWPNVDQAEIYTTVAAYSERTGATVLAEGIEKEAHFRRALALGATLGQGWYLGWPGPLGSVSSPSQSIGHHQPLEVTHATPYSFVFPDAVRVGTKDLLLGISQHLEHLGLALETPPIVLGAMQDCAHFTERTAQRYSALSLHCPIVAAFGAGMAPVPSAGVRGVPLVSDDPLRSEWVVAVVGAHYAGALIARDLGDTGPDLERRFSFVLTHKRDTVLAVARSLLERMASTTDLPDLHDRRV